MGWTNSHLHSFEFGNRSYSIADAEPDDLDMADEGEFTLEEVLRNTLREFIHEYAFGDNWRLRIKVRPLVKPNPDWSYPVCLAGERAARPADVGGPQGYEEFLSTLKDPKHEDHDRMLAWIGGAFDLEVEMGQV